MILKRLLALSLTVCLALSLAACGGSPAVSGSQKPDDSQSPRESDSPSESAPEPIPAYVNEYTQAVAGVDGDTVMFTVDGMDVTAEYFFYWLATDCYNLDMQVQTYSGLPLDFDQTTPDGTSFADYLKEDGRKWATAYLMLEKEAPGRGAGVTSEQQAELDAQTTKVIEERGRETYEKFLHQNGMSEKLYDRLNRMAGPLRDNMLASFPAPTQEEKDQYITENDLLRAKHILIRTVEQKEDGTVGFHRDGSGQPTNEDGSAYTGTAEDYNAAALEKVNGILEQLGGAEDPLALFDQLMQENSEDPGLAAYPDGYDFTAGEMVAEFEQGTRDLEYDAYSTQPVQTSDGYHIILRLRPEVSDNDWRQMQLSRQMDEWAALDFTATPAYEALDVKDFYEKYTAYMESFMDAPAESPSENPSESPDVFPSESPVESPAG